MGVPNDCGDRRSSKQSKTLRIKRLTDEQSARSGLLNGALANTKIFVARILVFRIRARN
jgi:hypothetical protein